MIIYLVRHAEKVEDKKESSLTKKGFRQRKYLAKHFKRIKISEFYSSELKRARQTSETVSKKIKINPKIEESLNEYKIEDLRTNFKNAEKEEKDRLSRLRKFTDKITKNRNNPKTILIISHGVTNRLIFSHLFNIDMKKLIGFMQKETGINKFEWDEKHKNWRLKMWNNSSHLPKRLK